MTAFKCPRCGMTSHNPEDAAMGYCGNCHATTVVSWFHQCLRCASLTDAAAEDRCGRCRDWPEYDLQDPTVGDFARLAEYILATRGQWTDVVMALMDAMKAASLRSRQENLDELDELARREAAGEVDLPTLHPSRMMTSEEAANQLGLPVETVRSWVVNPALRVGELRSRLVDVADDDLVMAEGADRVPRYVTAVQIEPQGDDGEGHVTSTGGTVWLALEES